MHEQQVGIHGNLPSESEPRVRGFGPRFMDGECLIGGIEVRITHPENPRPNTSPVALFPGFGISIDVLKACSKELDTLGYSVITSSQLPLNSSLPAIESALAAAIKKLSPTSKATILGYSKGGLIATHFALHHPESVDSLILFSSAGLTEKKTPFQLLRDFSLENAVSVIEAILDPRERVQQFTAQWDGTISTLRDLPAALRDTFTIAKSDIVSDLENLLEIIDMRFIHTDGDLGFRAGEVLQRLGRYPMLAGKLDIIKGGHGRFYTHPKDSMHAVHNAIESIKNDREIATENVTLAAD